MLATQVANCNQPEAPLQRLLRLAGAHPDQTISVAGPGSLDLMIALCRAGYERVECARQATCGGADETSDLLILACAPDRLAGLATRTLPLLRDGGSVAAGLTRMGDDLLIRDALLVRGMEILTTAIDDRGDPIVVHQIRRRERLAQVS